MKKIIFASLLGLSLAFTPVVAQAQTVSNEQRIIELTAILNQLIAILNQLLAQQATPVYTGGSSGSSNTSTNTGSTTQTPTTSTSEQSVVEDERPTLSLHSTSKACNGKQCAFSLYLRSRNDGEFTFDNHVKGTHFTISTIDQLDENFTTEYFIINQKSRMSPGEGNAIIYNFHSNTPGKISLSINSLPVTVSQTIKEGFNAPFLPLTVELNFE